MSELLEEIEEKIQGILDKAEETKEKAEDYLDIATAIDDRVKNNDPRDYVPLDDLPFGEERARLEGAPRAIESVIERLEGLDLNTVPLVAVSKVLDDANEVIDGVDSTLADIRPVPSAEDDEDDGF